MNNMKNPIIILLFFFFLYIDYTQATNTNCKSKLDQCQTNFFDELKQYKFNDHETSYYKLCSYDGSYMRFVDCVRQLSEQSGCNQPLHRELCNKRGIKISSYRYTWKSNLVHDICYRTSPLLDQDFFKYEKCISEVLNSPKWYCDVNYYEKTKHAQGLQACGHWKAFRQCIYEKVEEHCGKMMANLSDYLFHSHTSYFSKYTICNLPGEPHTKCWLDLIDSIPRMPVSVATTIDPITNTSVSMINSTTLIPKSPQGETIKATTTIMIKKIVETSTSLITSMDGKRHSVDEKNRQDRPHWEQHQLELSIVGEQETNDINMFHEKHDEHEQNLHTNLVREAKMNDRTENKDHDHDHQDNEEMIQNQPEHTAISGQHQGNRSSTYNISFSTILFSLLFCFMRIVFLKI